MSDLALNRREALGRIGLGMAVTSFGSALCAPLARAASVGDPGFTPVNRPFSAAQRAMVRALSERILPRTDTPGAIDAGVPDYIEMMVGDWYYPDERDRFLEILAALEAHSQSGQRKSFVRLKAAAQDAVITDLMRGTIPGAPERAFEDLRQLVITGYYSSEAGATQEQVYLPVPGRYNGDFPTAQTGRVFSG